MCTINAEGFPKTKSWEAACREQVFHCLQGGSPVPVPSMQGACEMTNLYKIRVCQDSGRAYEAPNSKRINVQFAMQLQAAKQLRSARMDTPHPLPMLPFCILCSDTWADESMLR